jgi:hypothetical protein
VLSEARSYLIRSDWSLYAGSSTRIVQVSNDGITSSISSSADLDVAATRLLASLLLDAQQMPPPAAAFQQQNESGCSAG